MNSASSSRLSTMPLQSDSSFWQLMEMLAEEPDLEWLGWVLCQREAATRQAEETAARSRSRPEVRATFLQGEPAADDEAPPPGEAAREQLSAGTDCFHCSFCRSQVSLHFGPRPLEALTLLEHSSHPRIWKTYRVGLTRFVAFREEAGLPSVWPLPREQIRGFLAAMELQQRSSPRILGYLAGLAYISRLLKFPDPLQDFVVRRMVIALTRRGDVQRRGWTPLSMEMLRCLVGVVDSVCTTSYNRVLFRAAFILAWFAALRPEEMVAEDDASPQPALLHQSDFAFSEDAVDIQLRVLGAGPERFAYHLIRSREPWLCPVLALSNYLGIRPRREGPFFIHENGEPLTKAQFLAVFHAALRLLGLFPEQFGLHSFWLGALITAVRCRLPEEVIQRLARWPKRHNPQL